MLCIHANLIFAILSIEFLETTSTQYEIQDETDVISCTTPKEEDGICISFLNCSSLYESLRTTGKTTRMINLLQASKCGLENNDVKICCPLKKIGKPEKNNEQICGQRRVIETLTGGSDLDDTSLGAWPWMTALGYQRIFNSNIEFRCGAVLITNSWLLTAAHCVTNLPPTISLTIARLGDLNLDDNIADGANPLDFTIQETIIHPKYFEFFLFDIALLKLNETIKFTEHIQPICLLNNVNKNFVKRNFRKKTLWMTGWNLFGNSKKSQNLKEIQVKLITESSCTRAYSQLNSNQTKTDKLFICGVDNDGSSCQVSSGGPLMIEDLQKNTIYLTGIASQEENRLDSVCSWVFTNITSVIDWINKETGFSSLA